MQIYLFISAVLFITGADSIKVSTPLGELEGRVLNDESVAFLAVPYAEAPTGDLRFQEPRSPAKWNGTLDATKYGPSCIQSASPFGRNQTTSENCLTLDIYVDGKSINPKAKMPVFVYIHGGAFTGGSSPENNLSKFVAGKGIIGVAIQYRLGFFGFAHSPNETVIPGNNGLKDQVAALQWVKKYIENFGGNSELFTVAGESAGSISVAYHLVSPLAANIMNRAILESGAINTMPALSAKSAEDNLRQVISLTECAKKSGDEQFQCLKNIPADQLQAVVDKLGGKVSFTPTVDSKYFCNIDPLERLETGNFSNNLDALIVGQNGNEGALFLTGLLPQILPITGHPRPKLWYQFELRAASVFFPRINQRVWNRVVTQTYRGRFAMRETDLANTLGQVFGDALFNCANFNFTEAYAKAYPNAKVYYYDFLTRPMKPETRVLMPYIRDALHAEEIPFIYGHTLLNEAAYTQDEINFTKKLIDEWTTFVKTGSVADKQWPLVKIDQGEVKPAHIVFFNAVHTEYREGFPGNECRKL